MELFLYSFIAWLLGGIINGIAGFGAAMIAMPILALGISLDIALPACTLIVLLASIHMTYKYRTFKDITRSKGIIIGSIPGAIFGLTLFFYLPEVAMKLWFGSFLIIYSLWSLFGKLDTQKVISPNWGYLAGFVSTSFGTTLGFNAPPLVIYFSLSGLNKDDLKSALSIFNVITCIIIVTSQAMANLYSTKVFMSVLAGAIAVFIGNSIGIDLSKRISEKMFRRILYMFLCIMGTSILVRI
ncbi:sulfite exporter TauE/SafE family protein [Desulfovibrio litoralis]|uniref:Probable membrane transporter protein n=1 Tax=Desulfovibrio litoralis DSM 11393 TaxID=1121455 RepID=A0A1M7SL19_9BACT|nr:sulfite exporter TauE/SafE family protein [Desulfovibrio litoralis]SHN59174.1 hypothetical protein SAMN02745728_00976 [Desulfovibrio litoralis DSM 11393]